MAFLLFLCFFPILKFLQELRCHRLQYLQYVTFFRKIFNRPRPYEKFATTSVFGKNKKGESMPSRHTACAFIIAMAFMYVSIPLGIAYLIISTLIMISRVLAGVHFISDVIAGMAISLLYGYFSFFII